MLVVMFHAFPAALPGGFIGVDVFFVISGYLITGIIISDLDNGAFTFRGFYARRIRRLFPALVVVLLATLGTGWILMLPADYEKLSWHAIAGAAFVPNFAFWKEVGYFDAAADTKPLLHLWSLGIEEQFYLLWPLLLMACRRTRFILPVLLSTAAFSFAFSVYVSWNDPAEAFYSPASRLWELAAGGILAIAKPRLHWSGMLAGLSLIIMSAFAISKADVFPGLLALLPVAGACLIIASAQSRVLSVGPLVSLGLISYPLYLWHWPMLTFARLEGYESAASMVSAVMASVLLASATYHLIEKPLRFGSRWPIPVAAIATPMVAVAVISVVIAATNGARFRFPSEILAVTDLNGYDATDQARVPECWLTASALFDAFDPACFEGSVLVWGDSHAARLYPGLAAKFGQVAQVTRDGCPPVIRSRDDNCSISNDAILTMIAARQPKVVVLFASWLSYAPPRQSWNDLDHLRQTVKAIRAVGVERVYVLGPAPSWDPALPIAVYRHWQENAELPTRIAPIALDYTEADRTIEGIALSEGASFRSVFNELCNPFGCVTHTPNSRSELLTWDYGHLTTEGAKFIVERLYRGGAFFR